MDDYEACWQTIEETAKNMIQIEVFGVPRPGGSKIPGINKQGKQYVRPASKYTAEWMQTVRLAARAQYKGRLLGDAVVMDLEFRMPRPKYHFRKNGTLTNGAPTSHTKTPDRTKLLRSTEDALKGIVFKDDCQVCMGETIKRYCTVDEKPGVSIVIQERKS